MTDRLTLRGTFQAPTSFWTPFLVRGPTDKKAHLCAYFTRNGLVSFLCHLKGRFLPIVCHVKERTRRAVHISQKFVNTMGPTSWLLRGEVCAAR